ncbi:O-antigen ligase [Marinospirillum celere]|uniref:O-antigen ligase n=1 Tax=Marinospirillum celere TaxID=1122252 RepID=A0A1I1EA45_9GAMM|nr:O-antigen ligase family protein [Marinospirillum celere]SFB83999.1 O-antigen ligase [Marinospirillum celere]
MDNKIPGYLKPWIVGAPILLFLVMTLTVSKGYSYGASLLLLVSLIWLFFRPRVQLDREDVYLIGALSFYFLVSLFFFLYHGESLDVLDAPSRFILAIPILIFLLHNPFRTELFWLGLGLGAVAVGLIAIYIKQTTGISRVRTDFMSPLQLGNLSMTFAVLCIAGISWAKHQSKHVWWILLLVLGACLAMTSSFLTGTRGGWVGIPLLMVVIFKLYSKHFSLPVAAGILALVASLVVTLYMLPSTGVQQRVDRAFQDVDQFIAGDPDSSVGRRLEMWRSGFFAFSTSPLVGLGEEGFKENEAHLIQEGVIDPVVFNHKSLHNQYIEELAKRGIIGLSGFLVLMLVPLLFFYRKMSSNDPGVRSFAAAGALLVLCYLDFNLTLTFFYRNNATLTFAFLLVVIWSAMRMHEKRRVSEKRVVG